MHKLLAFPPPEAIEFEHTPFPHFVLQLRNTPELYSALFTELNTFHSWSNHQESFYDQDEAIPSYACRTLTEITSKENIDRIRAMMEIQFKTNYSERVRVGLHRMQSGQGIGVHNDNPIGGDETHRFVIVITDGYELGDGGELVILNACDSSDVSKIVPARAGIAFGMEFSSCSFHAVTNIKKGTRYSIVYSFWSGAST